MINYYLEEIKKNLLTNIAEFDKSDTFMRSGQSDAQSVDKDVELSEGLLQKVEEFLASIKDQDDTIIKTLKGKDKI